MRVLLDNRSLGERVPKRDLFVMPWCCPVRKSIELRELLIGHFGKYHNILCLSPHILHKHCFQFLLGLKMAPRENKNNAYAKFGGTNKEYYGIFRTGLLPN